MINAKQALELSEKIGADVQHFLDHTVEPAVSYAAAMGERETFIVMGAKSAKELDQMLRNTPREKRVIAELRNLGFKVEYGFNKTAYEVPRVGKPMGEVKNYGYHISW